MSDASKKVKKFTLGFSLGVDFDSSPEADWSIIFVLGLISTLVVIALAVFIFIGIDRREIFVTEKSTEEIQTLDLERLRTTVRYYEAKALEFSRIEDGGVTSADPSI